MTELRADARRNLELVLDAAEQAFGASGPDASIDEIARLAGVGHGTVFRRFPTKDDLMYAVVERHVARIRALAEEALESDDPGAAFFDFARRAAELGMTTPGIHGCVVHCGDEAGCGRARGARLRSWSRARSGRVRCGATSSRARSGRSFAPRWSTAPPDHWRSYLDVVLDGLRA